jgi:HAD superfamily hydrolase (TIGR01484 family)
LVCTDLDRTLLPNGRQPESTGVREILARFVSREEVDLAYVSGRDLQLVLDAMADYELPSPRFIIGDVGTSIYVSARAGWQPSIPWQEAILADWGGCGPAHLTDALASIGGMKLQEPAKQGAAKVSYYVAEDADRTELEASIARCLEPIDVKQRLIWSADEAGRRALLDILPVSASKLHAIEFLVEKWHYSEERVLFAGDSGNDLEVLASGLPAVLVANAEEDVRSDAVEMATRSGNADKLYLARGGFLGTNGNYGGGILEGIAHFFPETIPWMNRGSRDRKGGQEP